MTTAPFLASELFHRHEHGANISTLKWYKMLLMSVNLHSRGPTSHLQNCWCDLNEVCTASSASFSQTCSSSIVSSSSSMSISSLLYQEPVSESWSWSNVQILIRQLEKFPLRSPRFARSVLFLLLEVSGSRKHATLVVTCGRICAG